ncbi:MAG TPA: serine/threonine-protein kinase, partial [Aggregatilineales bacterium]|nr:serine/threonine-protein kinase [Aggregatilineales bacterium]
MGSDNLKGQMLGQYELRELLGVGGMGSVYRGFQTALKREVAVKVLPSTLAQQPGYIERFTREAETSAALEHPHIVPIVDYGTQRGISYVVMRLLTGGTLAERINQAQADKRGLPSLGETAKLLRELASALDYAHNRGVIHRDIKTSNVMFDNQGNSYLVDFGIAKLMNATNKLTGTG